MLINIYARSMMTATRQPCVRVRDIRATPQQAPTMAPADSSEKGPIGGFAALAQRIKQLATGLRPAGRQLNQPIRCIDLQKL